MATVHEHSFQCATLISHLNTITCLIIYYSGRNLGSVERHISHKLTSIKLQRFTGATLKEDQGSHMAVRPVMTGYWPPDCTTSPNASSLPAEQTTYFTADSDNLPADDRRANLEIMQKKYSLCL